MSMTVCARWSSALIIASSCWPRAESGRDDPRAKPPLVRTAKRASRERAIREFTGVVGARVQSDLGFRIDGKITARLVDAGQTGPPRPAIDAHRSRRLRGSRPTPRRAPSTPRAGRAIADERRREPLPRPRRSRRGVGLGLRPGRRRQRAPRAPTLASAEAQLRAPPQRCRLYGAGRRRRRGRR